MRLRWDRSAARRAASRSPEWIQVILGTGLIGPATVPVISLAGASAGRARGPCGWATCVADESGAGREVDRSLGSCGRHNLSVALPSFAKLARDPQPAMDVLALAMAAEFRVVDPDASLEMLDVLGEDLSHAAAGARRRPLEVSLACGQLLGRDHGFVGDRQRYDHPDNSMLDIVLSRRRGLPILLSVVYIEVARRAGIPLAGVGLPGHFVVGHFGSDPPVLLDPFNAGARIDAPVPDSTVRPWRPHEIATRMLNNLVATYQRRGDLDRAIRAAQMRLLLPAPSSLRNTMSAELRALQARLN